ncbi:MAG: mannonate dehydratase [Ignavibacteriae bacterium]|nr:mannonate dehydratase [Ignavibacteriota bacterium]
MLEQTWRWFGPQDPVTLKEVKQTGATGVVTALHHLPTGTVWSVDDIMRRKQMIESVGLRWSVAESIPVHEAIKKRAPGYERYIENFKTSVRNLGRCGIDTVCYNFMPALDWSRTDLAATCSDGSIASRFEMHALVAFDLFILQRQKAEGEYSELHIQKARDYYAILSEADKAKLIRTILLGFPGSGESSSYSLEGLKSACDEYATIDKAALQSNLQHFLREIVPAAEESGVLLGIHPDDPPFSLFGLPRVVSTHDDLQRIIDAVDSPSNGITFCSGSLGAGYQNDVPALARAFAQRVNFIHLRNVSRNQEGDFMEENHLDGDVDMFEVMKVFVLEQQRRLKEGRADHRMPLRPDHGHLMRADQLLAETKSKQVYPGYSLFGRMRGLAELRGLELGVRRIHGTS